MQERDTVVFYGLSVIGHSSVCSEKDLQKNANRDRTTERRGGGGGQRGQSELKRRGLH